MKPKQQQLYDAIDKILWEDWDPIGINDNAKLRHEYQGYTQQIFKLKNEGADKYKIAKQLLNFEMVSMGLSGNMEHCRYIAEKIIEIKTEI